MSGNLTPVPNGQANLWNGLPQWAKAILLVVALSSTGGISGLVNSYVGNAEATAPCMCTSDQIRPIAEQVVTERISAMQTDIATIKADLGNLIKTVDRMVE